MGGDRSNGTEHDAEGSTPSDPGIGPGVGVPVVLDLDGDGVELIGLSSSRTYFDLSGDGFKENVGWVSGDDALLVIDIDGNDIIDRAAEVNFRLHAPNAQTDLDAIGMVFDTNRNGILDAGDSEFSKFKVWKDSNSDGITDGGELRSLSEMSIASISLTGPLVNEKRVDNIISRYATYTRNNGSTGLVGDVALKTSEFSYNITNGELSLKIGEATEVGVIVGSLDSWLSAGYANTFLTGGQGNDSLTGNAGDDRIIGGAGADTIQGGSGHDILFIDKNDSLNGGSGFDVAIVYDLQGTHIDLGATNIEAAIGGLGNDTFLGSALADYMHGGGGNDIIVGGYGSDTINGGSGNDVLSWTLSNFGSVDQALIQKSGSLAM